MAFKIAEAYVQISQRGMNNVSSAMSRLGSQTVSLGSAFGVAAAGLAGLATVAAAKGSIGLIKMSAAAEQTKVAFDVLLGSADASKQMIQQLTDFSARTPFSLPGLQDAAKTLLNFSVPANEVMSDIDMLSNIAAGSEDKLSSLSLVFGQIASTGRLMGQDLLQLINSGFNPLQQISERTGESMADLKKRMEDGGIGFSEVRQAFADATSEGGRFYQMNEKQSQTVSGLWSTLKDNVLLNLREVSDAAISAFDLRGALQTAIAGVKQFSDFAAFTFDNFGTLAAIGVEHIKLFATNAFERVKAWATNSLNVASWFGSSLATVMQNAGQTVLTIFSNLTSNITVAFQKAQNKMRELYLKAKEMVVGSGDYFLQTQLEDLKEAQDSAQFKGLLDGLEFKEIAKLPKMVEAQLQTVSPDIELLKNQLKIRVDKSTQDAIANLKNNPIQDSIQQTKADPEGDTVSIEAERPEARANSASMGAASFVSSLQGKILDHSAKIQEKQERHLRELKEFMMREGIPIKGGVAAVAG